MFVTCLYDIYNIPEKIVDYIKYFESLAESGIKIHVYTDPKLAPFFSKFIDNVKIIPLPLKYVEIFQIGMTSSTELPDNRSKEKDTKEYFSLMNSKIEFVLKSMNVCEDETMAWIDFGILKLCKNPQLCCKLLKKIENIKFDKLYIPGSWNQDAGLFMNSVHWRFCGSFVIGPRSLFKTFFEDTKKTFLDGIDKYNLLIWETNIWCSVEFCGGNKYINWYKASHNDTMILNLIRIKDPNLLK